MKKTIIILIAVLLTSFPGGMVHAQNSLDAQVSLGNMRVKDKVKITLIDGSEITLENEKYPIYPDMIIDTLDDGQATLIVKGGKYVIEPESIFKVQSIGEGHTGLLLTRGDEGEVCYCFNPKGGYLVDTPEADTVPTSETVVKAGGPQYVDGRTNVKENITSAMQFDGYSDFRTQVSTQTLEPGDATSNPEKQNPYESFERKSGCCTPGAAPLLVPAAIGAAAVTGAIIGASDDDGTASKVVPSSE